MASVGRGVWEIRIQDEAGAFRVLYVANTGSAISVLHAFQKKRQQTAKRDLVNLVPIGFGTERF